MSLSENLAALKQRRRMTTQTLSERAGVPKGTINKLLNGETRNPRLETLCRLSEALGCPVEALTDGANADTLPVRRRRVPLIGEIAAGRPIYAEEETEQICVDDALHCDFALKVRGNSMIGARIRDGDTVFIRAQDDVEDGQIAAVIIDDSATLKHVYHLKNGLQLISENPEFPPMVFTFEDFDNIRIIGKAVGFQSRL